jgi:hypothetical protein
MVETVVAIEVTITVPAQGSPGTWDVRMPPRRSVAVPIPHRLDGLLWLPGREPTVFCHVPRPLL